MVGPAGQAVVDAMEWMADGRWSLGRPTLNPDLRYWPVPPLGLVDRVVGDELIVAAVIDARRSAGSRSLGHPDGLHAAARSFSPAVAQYRLLLSSRRSDSDHVGHSASPASQASTSRMSLTMASPSSAWAQRCSKRSR